MNAGKSTALLQSNYNYHERGMETLLFLPKIDAEKNNGKIHSRIGLEADAVSVDVNFNFFNYVSQKQLAKSITLNDCNLGINISPPFIIFIESITNLTPSSKVILNLVIFLSVTVIFIFLFNKSLKKGATDPLLPKTFPYLTTEKKEEVKPE